MSIPRVSCGLAHKFCVNWNPKSEIRGPLPDKSGTGPPYPPFLINRWFYVANIVLNLPVVSMG
nr:MAG TPA: hypothetical protein [Caudoviricetes sp.]